MIMPNIDKTFRVRDHTVHSKQWRRASYLILYPLLMVGCCLLAPWQGLAQDVHFSQTEFTPMLVNPAMTGTFNGSHRVIANYRDQWRSVSPDAPFTTYMVTYDGALMKRKWKNAFLGAGALVYRDRAGDSKMSITKIDALLSSIVNISETQHLSVGIRGGVAHRSVDLSKLTWDNQFNGIKHDPSLPDNEAFSNQSDFFLGDVAAGISWAYGTGSSTLSSNDRFSVRFGLAGYHLNQPKLKFASDVRLYNRFLVHGSSFIGLKNSSVALVPNFVIVNQGPSMEYNLGFLARYTIKEESKYTGIFKESAVYLGSHFRIGDAVMPMVVFEYANYSIAFSYDINISKLRSASSGKGGFEIAIRYINPNPFKYGAGSNSNVKFL